MARKVNRRGKGEGSIIERKDGRWVAQVQTGYNENGSPKYAQRSAKTQKEAIEKLDTLKREVHGGTYSDTKTTVKQYLSGWLDTVRGEVTPKTLKSYTLCVGHLNRHLGGVQLNKLGSQQIKRALLTIRDESVARNEQVGRSGDGVRTANLCRTVLRKACEDAVNDAKPLLMRNPVNFKPQKATPKEISIWTPAQMGVFLRVARESSLYPLFVLAVGSGLRLGELGGLRWRDVDVNAVNVRQALKLEDGKLVFGPPKSKAARRRVTVSGDVTAALEAHRETQAALKKEFGSEYQESGLVFTTALGTPLQPRNVERTFYDLQERARAILKGDLPHGGIHTLRHFHASIAIHGGMNVRTLADRLGHSDVTLTLRTYTHVFDEVRANSAVDISGLLTPEQSPLYAN